MGAQAINHQDSGPGPSSALPARLRTTAMRKRALITGITGQDGSYLAELLLSKNYSRAPENSPSSIPSPTYQCTKARWAYIKSYLALILSVNTRHTATLFPIIVTFFFAGAVISPSTIAAGTSFKPILKPVGHHSTKLFLLFCFSHCTVAFASLDLMSPR